METGNGLDVVVRVGQVVRDQVLGLLDVVLDLSLCGWEVTFVDGTWWFIFRIGLLSTFVLAREVMIPELNSALVRIILIISTIDTFGATGRGASFTACVYRIFGVFGMFRMFRMFLWTLGLVRTLGFLVRFATY